MKGNESGVSSGEVDEPACCKSVFDESSEVHLRENLVELVQGLASG